MEEECDGTCVHVLCWAAYRIRKEEEAEKVQTGILAVLLSLAILKTNTKRIKSKHVSNLSVCDSYVLWCFFLLC